MNNKYILAIDAGTTGVRTVLYDKKSTEIAIKYDEFTQITPEPSLLEHDPLEIWNLTKDLVIKVVKEAGIQFIDIAALGLATQRSTAVAWDKNTGIPVHNAIVWQDLRTNERSMELSELFGREISPLATYTKYEWLLDNVPNCRERVENGDVLMGTMDSWLIWKLTNGKSFITDPANAVSSFLWNPMSGEWMPETASIIQFPVERLAQLVSSSEVYGVTDKDLFDVEIPIAALTGDQQAAMYGHLATERGEGKASYGTSVMVDVNTGTDWIETENSFPLALWRLNGEDTFCLEGQVVTAGASINWAKEMNIFEDIKEVSMEDNLPEAGGVYFVPALQGLGAPYMDTSIKGGIIGLTRATKRQHVVKAILEAIAFRTKQVVELLRDQVDEDAFPTLQVDGGMSTNDYFMQLQADILGINVERHSTEQVTSLGIAYLAGLAVGYWEDEAEIKKLKKRGTVFIPNNDNTEIQERFEKWKKIIDAVRGIET